MKFRKVLSGGGWAALERQGADFGRFCPNWSLARGNLIYFARPNIAGVGYGFSEDFAQYPWEPLERLECQTCKSSSELALDYKKSCTHCQAQYLSAVVSKAAWRIQDLIY